MKFEQFLSIEDGLKGIPNIGEEAHRSIFPEITQHRQEALRKDPNPRLSAVAAIFFPDGNETSLLLIERQTYEGVHSGQIGFPGGRKEEEDEDLEHTARRETEEEVGIAANELRLIRPISQVYIPPSRFLVHPYLFAMDAAPQIVPDPREVRSTLNLPVSRLLDDDTLVSGSVDLQAGVSIKTKYFYWGDKKIWGATAMMLSEVKVLLQRLNG